MKKPIKSKYPELLEIRNRHYQATDELKEAFKNYYNFKFVSSQDNSTEQDYLNTAIALEQWDAKDKEVDEIQIQINQYTNLKFYGKQKSI